MVFGKNVLQEIPVANFGIHGFDTLSHSIIYLRHFERGFSYNSFEPISERSTSKSSHEPSVELVRTDIIGTF